MNGGVDLSDLPGREVRQIPQRRALKRAQRPLKTKFMPQERRRPPSGDAQVDQIFREHGWKIEQELQQDRRTEIKTIFLGAFLIILGIFVLELFRLVIIELFIVLPLILIPFIGFGLALIIAHLFDFFIFDD